MKYFPPLFFCLFLLMTPPEVSARDSLSQIQVFPTGIAFEGGTGSYAQTDEYISGEKYAGNLLYYNVSWTHQHQNYIYQIGMEFRSSSALRNYNVSTRIFQFSLIQGFLHPLPAFLLFSQEAHVYVGPSTEIFLFSNNQNIAVHGFDYAESFAGLISLGLNSALIYPVSSRLNIESYLNFGVLSLGLRMVDVEENDESPGKLLTVFSGTNGSFRLGVRYHLLRNLSLRAAYVLGITRIRSWEPLHIASDNLTLSVTYGF